MANTTRVERNDDDMILVTDYGYQSKFSEYARRVKALEELVQESQAMGFYDLDRKSNFIDDSEENDSQPV